MLTALVRDVPDSINDCELTFLERQPIDLAVARLHHAHYVAALSQLGVQVRYLPVEHALPDSVFVEDMALVLDELAVVMRPGAESRRPEVDSVAEALRPHRKVVFVEPPATIDGGDVIVLGSRIFVGATARSNAASVAALEKIVGPFGYSVSSIPIDDCLHLKSAATALDNETVLVNPSWVEPSRFRPARTIEVDPAEPDAANAVQVGDVLLYAAEFPRTRERLEDAGYVVHTVPASELAKAEGAVTCCSLIFDAG